MIFLDPDGQSIRNSRQLAHLKCLYEQFYSPQHLYSLCASSQEAMHK